MSESLKAAVIGASGMGRHHAKWFHLLGAEVVAFAGSSPESVKRTAGALSGLFDFTGRGYSAVARMLETERPDLVSICSPPQLHREHLLAAVGAGCHVICEKPVAWYEDDPARDPLADAQQMLEATERAGVVAAVNTQYAAAVEPYLRLLEIAGRADEIADPRAVEMTMESRGRGGRAVREQIWLDLASHPLSVVQAFCGPGEMVAGSARCLIEEKQVTAAFTYAAPERRSLIEARVIVGNRPEGPLARRIGVNGVVADYDGRNDEDGQFSAYLRIGEDELKATDFVQESLTRFVAAARGHGAPLMTLADGVANLRMQVEILRAGA